MSNPKNGEDGNGIHSQIVDSIDELQVIETTTIDTSSSSIGYEELIINQQKQQQQQQQHGQRQQQRQRRSNSIVDQLFRDMSINKHSIKDCLRSKKTLPCLEVIKILQNNDYKINSDNNNNNNCDDNPNNENDNDTDATNNNNNKTSYTNTSHNSNNTNNCQITQSDLIVSYNIIMENYLNPIVTVWKAKHSKNFSEFQGLLFESISDIATAIRFVQLLLEYKVLYTEQDQQQQQKHVDDEFVSTTTTSVQNDFVQYIFNIIRSLTTIIVDLCQFCIIKHNYNISDDNTYNQLQEDDCHNNDELYTCSIFDNVCTIDTLIIQLSYYTFGSLLRLNEYVQVHPFLLPPLWKGLCTIVQSIEKSNTKRLIQQNDQFQSTDAVQVVSGIEVVCNNSNKILILPTELLVSALQSLSEHISDGCQQIMISTLANHNTTNDDYPMQYSTNSKEQNEFRIKIILFLLSRLTVFLNHLSDNFETIPTHILDTLFQTLLILNGIYCSRNFGGTSTTNGTTTTSPSKVTRKVCKLIENESGLSLQIGIGRNNDDTIEKKNIQSTITTSQLLQRKVEYILLSYIGLQQCGDTNSTSGCSINITKLKILLQTISNWKINKDDDDDDDESITEIHRFTFLSFMEGMNSFLIKVLSEMNHTSINNRDNDTNVILFICERILFTTMPLLCLYNNNNNNNKFTQPSILIDQTIKIISSTLLRCEIQLINSNSNNSSNSFRRNQFHCIVLSWLHQPESNIITINTNKSYSIVHKKSSCLQQEITIEILYILIISLGRLQKRLSQQFTSMNTSTMRNLLDDKNRKKIHLVSRPIINLLIHLLFDVRTSTTFRRNIFSLVHRLLHSSENTIVVSTLQKAYHKSITLFIATFVQLKETNIENRKRKKRKRDKQQQIHQRYYTAADIEIITDPIVVANINYFDHDIVCHYTSYMESIVSKHNSTKRQIQRTVLITFIIVLSLMINRSTVVGGTRSDETTSNSYDVKVIKLFRKVWNLCNDRLTTKSKDKNYCNLLSLCGKRVSQLVGCIVQKPNIFTLGLNNKNPIMDRINGFLTFCIISNVIEAIHKPTKHPLLFDLLFESINVLSTCSIGNVINLIPNNQLQMNIIEMWRNHILSSTLWPIRHYAMSKFILSISTVPSPKGNFALDCVPTHAQSLLQTRIQKIIDDKSKHLCTKLHSDYENVLRKIDVHRFTDLLADHECTTSTTRSSTGTEQHHQIVNSYWIQEGSYVMKMPTQEGRSAIVIFPPTEQSLDDISTLMGANTVYHEQYSSQKSNDDKDTNNSQDNDEQEQQQQQLEQPSSIQILCRSKSYHDNGGCQLWLQPLNKRIKK